jgi:hypothetical protein
MYNCQSPRGTSLERKAVSKAKHGLDGEKPVLVQFAIPNEKDMSVDL